jgi:hypothetical protein
MCEISLPSTHHILIFRLLLDGEIFHICGGFSVGTNRMVSTESAVSISILNKEN